MAGSLIGAPALAQTQQQQRRMQPVFGRDLIDKSLFCRRFFVNCIGGFRLLDFITLHM